MKEKVLVASMCQPLNIVPFNGETILNPEKHLGLEMYTGIKSGILSCFYKGHEIGIPITMVSGIKWEKGEPDKQEITSSGKVR